jgi:hypothetical protein
MKSKRNRYKLLEGTHKESGVKYTKGDEIVTITNLTNLFGAKFQLLGPEFDEPPEPKRRRRRRQAEQEAEQEAEQDVEGDVAEDVVDEEAEVEDSGPAPLIKKHHGKGRFTVRNKATGELVHDSDYITKTEAEALVQ